MKTTNVGIMDTNVNISVQNMDTKYKAHKKKYMASNMSEK
jgi:hypothetical protein